RRDTWTQRSDCASCPGARLVTDGRLAVDQTPMTALESVADAGRRPLCVTDVIGTSIAIEWTLRPASESRGDALTGGTLSRSNTFSTTKNGPARWPATTCEWFGSV